jgi:hypothetical protein
MTGLYPDNRRVAPTARMILYTLSALDLHPRERVRSSYENLVNILSN